MLVVSIKVWFLFRHCYQCNAKCLCCKRCQSANNTWFSSFIFMCLKSKLIEKHHEPSTRRLIQRIASHLFTVHGHFDLSIVCQNRNHLSHCLESDQSSLKLKHWDWDTLAIMNIIFHSYDTKVESFKSPQDKISLSSFPH